MSGSTDRLDLLPIFRDHWETFKATYPQTTTGKPLDIGCAMVLQTYGRSGEFNPHLHILVTAGGLTTEGKWKNRNFIPDDVMHRKWQYHLLDLLRQEVHDPGVQKDIDRG